MKNIGFVLGVLMGYLGTTHALRADVAGVAFDIYTVRVSDVAGGEREFEVRDLYLLSNRADFVLLNVFDLQYITPCIEAGVVDVYQSVSGAGWLPRNEGGRTDTEALRRADSFVTIGGFVPPSFEQSPGSGESTGIDPLFGKNSVVIPGPGGGWYNGNPPNLNGRVTETPVGRGVLVARFTFEKGAGPRFELESFSVTWNRGLGTAPSSASLDFQCPGCCFPTLPEDLNRNSTVDSGDLGLLLASFSSDCAAADFDESGLVDAADLGRLLSVWGESCFGIVGHEWRITSVHSESQDACDLCDLDNDGSIGGADIAKWKALVLAGEGSADVNQDGSVDSRDLGSLLAAWSERPEEGGDVAPVKRQVDSVDRKF